MAGIYRLKAFDRTLAAGSHVVPRSQFEDIETANGLVAEAEAKAARIQADAEIAYAEEKKRGYAEGLEQARVEAVGRLLEESAELDRGLIEVEHDLSRLVAAAVRKIIDGFDEAARAESVVRSALTQMRREKRAELRVPSRLYAHFKQRIDAIVADFPEVDLVDVIEDPALSPSQIIVETSIGRVDGNLADRLDELETTIRSAHARVSADRLDAIGMRRST